jgi:thiol-disulfide isomerase/thioredoxin
MVVGYIAYYFYKSPKFDSGESAPNFSSTLINGSKFNLSDLQGDYVLLDFWGSWCGPCRRESPNLVKLHNQFSNVKGSDGASFHILSVAVETDEKRWKKAIEQDRLSWPLHIYETGRFKSPIVSQYGVNEIPTKYLLGKDGNVLFTNPSFEEIEMFLADKLK